MKGKHHLKGLWREAKVNKACRRATRIRSSPCLNMPATSKRWNGLKRWVHHIKQIPSSKLTQTLKITIFEWKLVFQPYLPGSMLIYWRVYQESNKRNVEKTQEFTAMVCYRSKPTMTQCHIPPCMYIHIYIYINVYMYIYTYLYLYLYIYVLNS